VAGRDITEGRATRAIAVDVGVVSTSAIWQNTDVAYDVAVGGMPFIYAISDARPYIRQTAPFRKEQFDNQTEPGEQSFTGWWFRSQSSCHLGAGAKFFEPAQDETLRYRFFDSEGVDVWTKGEVSLLKNVDTSHVTTSASLKLRSIRESDRDEALLLDGHDVDKVFATNEFFK
jgi:hypothetical protein